MRRLVVLVAERGALADPAALVFASRNGSASTRTSGMNATPAAA
jgi:hypothetical protein